ncbi:MAG: hypothetical protein IJ831_02795 [Spirochaetales bacterium]|nr:hypothetical protein [Spirochaetales bacterium]
MITFIAVNLSLLLLLALPAGFSYLCGLLAISLAVGFGSRLVYLVMIAEVVLLLLSMWKQTRTVISFLLPIAVSILPLAYFQSLHMLVFTVSLFAVSYMFKGKYLNYSKSLSTAVVFAFYIAQQYYLSTPVTFVFVTLFFILGLLLSRSKRYN